MNDSETLGVAFLIFLVFPTSCLTSMIEPLRAAIEIAGTPKFTWQLVSEQGGKTTSSAGVVYNADVGLDDVQDDDLLVLLSSPASQFADPRHGQGVLRSVALPDLVCRSIQMFSADL